MELEDSTQNVGDYEKEYIWSMFDDLRDELIAICADVRDLIDSKILQNVKIRTREKGVRL